jgi:hypothetical protein
MKVEHALLLNAYWSIHLGSWPDEDEPLLVVTAPVGSFARCQRSLSGYRAFGRRRSLAAARRADLAFLQSAFGLRSWDHDDDLVIPDVQSPSVTVTDQNTVIASIAGTPWVEQRLNEEDAEVWQQLSRCLIGVAVTDDQPRDVAAFIADLTTGNALIGETNVWASPPDWTWSDDASWGDAQGVA